MKCWLRNKHLSQQTRRYPFNYLNVLLWNFCKKERGFRISFYTIKKNDTLTETLRISK